MYLRTSSRVRFYIVTMNSCFICFPSEEEEHHNNAGMLAPTSDPEEAPALAVSKNSKSSKKNKNASIDEAPKLVKGEDGLDVIPL